MSKAQKIDKAIGWLTIAGAAYFVGTAIAGAIKRKRETTSGIGATTPTYSKQRLNAYIQSHDVRELVAQYETRNKVLCEVGDEQGGRSFYLTRKNFLYLFNFCLFKYAPIAVWTGDHWLTRNNGDVILLS